MIMIYLVPASLSPLDFARGKPSYSIEIGSISNKVKIVRLQRRGLPPRKICKANCTWNPEAWSFHLAPPKSSLLLYTVPRSTPGSLTFRPEGDPPLRGHETSHALLSGLSSPVLHRGHYPTTHWKYYNIQDLYSVIHM